MFVCLYMHVCEVFVNRCLFKQHILSYFCQIKCAVQMYKTKIRVHSSIFELVLTAEEFEDVKRKGLESGIVKIFLPCDATSTVIGTFKHSVEILSMTPVKSTRPGPGGEVMEQPQAMKFEVNVFVLVIK